MRATSVSAGAMACFYSADSTLVFSAEDRFEDAAAQHTVLFNATTRVPVGSLGAGARCSTVRLNVHENRLIALVHSEGGEQFCVTPQHTAADVALTQDVLVAEVLHLFFRGHSMYADGCECAPRVHKTRQQHLGLSSRPRAGGCVLGRKRQFTSSELAAELGCSTLDAECEGRSVRQVLLASEEFDFDNTQWRTRRVVRCQDSLVWYLLVNPLGVNADDWFMQYPDLARDLKALKASRAAYVLKNSEGDNRVFVNSIAFTGVEALDKYRCL